MNNQKFNWWFVIAWAVLIPVSLGFWWQVGKWLFERLFVAG